NADVEREKTWLYAEQPDVRHLALIVVHPDAVEPTGSERVYGAYDLYVPPNLDDRAESEIRRNLREALVNARISAQGLDPAAIDAMTEVPRIPSITVSAQEERRTVGGLNFLFPVAFGALLFIGVMTGG